MDEQSIISRRRFVSLSLIGLGGVCFFARCVNPYPAKWRFFTANEVELLDALVEQIIPTDDWPGARDAGVTNFIDRQLIGTYTRFQIDYSRGLKAVQESCVSLFRMKFETLDWDQQTRLLETMEAGQMEGEFWANGFDRRFFNLLCDHTMQGFYGSPRHGGNIGYVSYKMIKLDYPHLIGRNKHNI